MLCRINSSDKERLIDIFSNLIFDDYFKYVSDIKETTHSNFADPNNTNQVEFISKNSKNDIIGYYFAHLDIRTGIGHISNVVNFSKEPMLFGRDLRKFVDMLKQYGITKLEFSVWEGNPAKETYDKIPNVRYIGYYTKGAIHRGELLNIHLYELFI